MIEKNKEIHQNNHNTADDRLCHISNIHSIQV